MAVLVWVEHELHAALHSLLVALPNCIIDLSNDSVHLLSTDSEDGIHEAAMNLLVSYIHLFLVSEDRLVSLLLDYSIHHLLDEYFVCIHWSLLFLYYLELLKGFLEHSLLLSSILFCPLTLLLFVSRSVLSLLDPWALTAPSMALLSPEVNFPCVVSLTGDLHHGLPRLSLMRSSNDLEVLATLSLYLALDRVVNLYAVVAYFVFSICQVPIPDEAPSTWALCSCNRLHLASHVLMGLALTSLGHRREHLMAAFVAIRGSARVTLG